MKRYIVLIIALVLLAGCGPNHPLPMISDKDPVWPLTPDRLEFGALPQ
jgi:uncharacterized protein YcfL